MHQLRWSTPNSSSSMSDPQGSNKKRSGEIRDQIRSQSHQQQYATYADATIASKGNTAGRGMGTSAGVPGLSKSETKEIVTTIMSAIVFSHYVEAIEPSSFQKTMTDMYKKMASSQLTFPPHPRTTSSCKLTGKYSMIPVRMSQRLMTMTKTMMTRHKKRQMTLKENHRQKDRESLTLLPIRMGKRKKEESMVTPIKKCNNEEMPQGYKGEGGAKPKANSRPIEKDQPSRSCSPSSHSKAKYTKDIGLLMLAKQSSNIEANNKNLRERNRILMAAIEGEVVKFQWSNPNTNYEKIKHELKKGILGPNQILYRNLEDDLFDVSDTKYNSNTFVFAQNLSL